MLPQLAPAAVPRRTCSKRSLHFWAVLAQDLGQEKVFVLPTVLLGARDANPKMGASMLVGFTITPPPSSPHCPILLGSQTAPGPPGLDQTGCKETSWQMPHLPTDTSPPLSLRSASQRPFIPFAMNFLLFSLIDIFSPRFVSFSSPVWPQHISILGARDSY